MSPAGEIMLYSIFVVLKCYELLCVNLTDIMIKEFEVSMVVVGGSIPDI